MKANVDKLLAAATATDIFEFVEADPFDENDDYPAFFVGTRKADNNPKDSLGKVYRKQWKYMCYVLVALASGFNDLDTKANTFFKQLVNDNVGEFWLEDEEEMTVSIGDKEILVRQMTIMAKTYTHSYLN